MRNRITLPWLATLVASGCITSPVWEHGPTLEVRTTQLGPCESGMLDDMEDNNPQILKQAGREGYWFSYKDDWGSTISPSGDFKMSPCDRPQSQFCARMHGQMARNGESLYVGMGFSLTNPRSRYDTSPAQGIRFWAKGPGKVRFKTPDANTSPEGDRCKACYNDFGVDLQLQDTWVRYTVPFAKMGQQPGWGDRAPEVAKHELYSVNWQFVTPGADYDIWIDDVELVGCEPGTP